MIGSHVTGPVENFWLSQGLDCMGLANLVYVKTWKTASTYYGDLFRFHGWQPVPFDCINWQVHEVFGFIRDPRVRYIKALAEDCCLIPSIRPVVEQSLTSRSSDICLLTPHSMPISSLFGHHVYDIRWIPIDTDHDHEIMLEQILGRHGITVDWCRSNLSRAQPPRRHESDQLREQLYQQFQSQFGDGSSNWYKIFARDIDLYNQACAQQVN